MKRIILLVILLLTFLLSRAQVEMCDSVYTVVEKMPEYSGGPNSLIKFAIDSLSAKFSCLRNHEPIVSSLYFTFIISDKGKIVSAKMIKPSDLGLECKEELESVFYKMGDWKPGILNGKAVCTRVNFPVTCIKWTD